MPYSFSDSMNWLHEPITVYVKSQPESIGGGDYVEDTETSYTLKGFFIPQIKRRLVTSQYGDKVISTMQVVFDAYEWTSRGISPSVRINKIVYSGRNYKVITVEDYSKYNRTVVLTVTAEVDGPAY